LSDPGSDAASFVLGPVGGAIIGALLYPTGCATALQSNLLCPTGKQTNFLGWTMGGAVGTVDKVGAFVIGVIAAVLVYGIVSHFSSSSS
jgi:hypothetical protein